MNINARVGAAAGGGVKIPPSAMEVVRSLKEIVENSDDEIYAMLKECNMDLNETAQRLLNQANFHEVKRRRDRKKEGGTNKESADLRTRPGSGGSNPTRGGRGGGGRGHSVARLSSQGMHSAEYSSGRGKPFPLRENGIHPSLRSSSAVSTPSLATLPHRQMQPMASGPIAASTPAQTLPSTGAKSGSTLSGSSIDTFSPPVLQGAWGSGHGTVADILRSSGMPTSQPTPSHASLAPAVSQPYLPDAHLEPSSEQSDFHSSSADPVLPQLLASQALGAQDAIKRDVGTVGNQRPVGDRPSGSFSVDVGPGVASLQPQVAPATGIPSSPETDLEAQVIRPPSPSHSVSLPSTQDQPAGEAVPLDDGGSNEAQSQQTGGIGSSGPGLGGSQFNGRPMYPSQQQPVGTQKAPGVGMEWNVKASVQDHGGLAIDAQVPTTTIGEMGKIVDSLQSLNIQYQHPVVIPNHLQVPEADCTNLSFGSFGADFGTIFSSKFRIDTADKGQVVTTEGTPGVDVPVEQSIPSSVPPPVTPAQSYGHQTETASLENLGTSNDEVAPLSVKVTQPLELPKPDPVVQQGPHYPYLPPAANYSGFGLVPQLSGGQYGYEALDSQPPDLSRLPSLMQPYTDPTSSYYTPAFRTGIDGDGRYPSYVASNTASKYNGNVGLMTGSSLQSSQESGKHMMSASGPGGIPASQPGNSAQTVPSLPQQPLPMHPYAAQPPLGHFGNYLGYQYVPPNYPYMHTAYQHNYGPSNNAYAQAPTASSYPSAAVSAYPAGSSAPVKYPVPQYKPGVATGNAPHSASAVGYEGYSTPSGYGSNPVGTASNTSGYDDVAVSHYKDNSLYIPNQQTGESSAVWMQSQQLPRDTGPSSGMQTSSYYNLVGQGQHSAYVHSQPAHTHGHPGSGYGNPYHPSQSVAAPNTHQMLQQPQTLGSSGAGSIQGGAYQQAQRSQQTWTNNY